MLLLKIGKYCNNNKKNESNNITNNKEDEEYCLNYHTDKPFIKINFKECPNIGLQNIGATCYMNAILQCFCHVEKFIDFFKYSNQIINIVKNDKKHLSSSFKLLIEKLWPNNYNNQNENKYYAPEEFKSKILTMNPLFEEVAGNEAKDLVNFLIMTLHEELNKAHKNDINQNDIIIDESNQIQVFQNFSENFFSKNQSIITDLFFAINCNITECGNCHSKIFNYQIYFFLEFPLEEILNFKNQYNSFSNLFNFYEENNFNI